MRLMRFHLPFLAVVAALAACPEPSPPGPTGCTDESQCGADEICLDRACVACEIGFNLPAPNDPCLPKCGNELGVGQPCTRGGLECNHNADIHGLFCTVDNVADASLQMCTGPCGEDSDCGSNSVCQGDPADGPDGQKGCVPASCAGEGEGEGE